MKTLKLTDAEWVTLKEVYLFHPIFPNKDGLLDVDDTGEFREFLNDKSDGKNVELGRITMSDYNNLKSILNKLN